jgi:hypothetical protein
MSAPRTALVLGPYSALVAGDVAGFAGCDAPACQRTCARKDPRFMYRLAHPDPAGCRCWFLPAPDAREAPQ